MYLPLLSDHGSDSDSGVIVVPVLNELNQKRLVNAFIITIKKMFKLSSPNISKALDMMTLDLLCA